MLAPPIYILLRANVSDYPKPQGLENFSIDKYERSKTFTVKEWADQIQYRFDLGMHEAILSLIKGRTKFAHAHTEQLNDHMARLLQDPFDLSKPSVDDDYDYRNEEEILGRPQIPVTALSAAELHMLYHRSVEKRYRYDILEHPP